MLMTALIAVAATIQAPVPPAPAAPFVPDPALYAGRYPFDAVEGVAFLDHPAVRAAVRRAVRDPAIRNWILEPGDSPSPKMYRSDGVLIAAGCQFHACNARSWAILFDPVRQTARVCYHDGAPHWFAADGRREKTTENCPYGSVPILPGPN